MQSCQLPSRPAGMCSGLAAWEAGSCCICRVVEQSDKQQRLRYGGAQGQAYCSSEVASWWG